MKKQAVEQMKTVTEISLRDIDGKEFKIKVQRPRLFTMAAQGKIPNALLGVASKMISGKKAETGNLKEIGQMMELYCRVCMVEPTFDEVCLDDEQMLTVFTWATTEVDQLSTFRQEPEDSQHDSNVEGVPDEAQPAPGD